MTWIETLLPVIQAGSNNASVTFCETSQPAKLASKVQHLCLTCIRGHIIFSMMLPFCLFF